jgi:hypothetical protein
VYDGTADWSSLTEALLALGSAADANHIFNADGNTYVYISGADEYSSSDVLIELTGGVDPVLLPQVIAAA